MKKLAKRNEKENLFGNSETGSRRKQVKKQIRADRHSSVDNNRRNADVPAKRKSLKELRKECPPGFRKFELEVGLDSINEEIALQLWEDVFQPLHALEPVRYTRMKKVASA